MQLVPRHIRRRRRLPRSFVARPLRWYSALDSAHRRGLSYGSAPRFGSRARDRTRTGGVRKHLVLGGQMRAFSEVTQSCTRRARSRSERPFPTFQTGRTCAVCSATNSLACACRLWGTCIRFRPRPSKKRLFERVPRWVTSWLTSKFGETAHTRRSAVASHTHARPLGDTRKAPYGREQCLDFGSLQDRPQVALEIERQVQ